MPRSLQAQREYRRQKRAELKEQYVLYEQRCAEEGVVPDPSRWLAHLADIEAGTGRRLTREEMFAFWRERLSDREIREVASAIDFLLKEQE